MSSAAATAVQAAAPYWRTAGITYLTYANSCATMVRNCLKEPFKSKALQREHAFYKVQPYADGAPQKADLPGFTRSVYERDHALVTPKSQVFSPLPRW